MKKLVFTILAGSLMFVSSVVYAQEEGSVDSKGEEARNKVLDAAEDFTKDMDKVSARHFNVLYGNYNLVKVVETVKDDVGAAVKACGEANPDKKDPLNARYDEWKKAVEPVLKEAEGNVDNMVVAQDYADPRDIRNFLRMVDKTREEQAKEVEKVPVTSPEACDSLLNKMDGSQEQMVKLLQMTLVSLPLLMQDQDEAKKAEEEEKARQKAADEAAKADKPEDL